MASTTRFSSRAPGELRKGLSANSRGHQGRDPVRRRLGAICASDSSSGRQHLPNEECKIGISSSYMGDMIACLIAYCTSSESVLIPSSSMTLYLWKRTVLREILRI